MNVYLHIPNIQGNATLKHHEGWIELLDAEFSGVSTNAKMAVGRKNDRVSQIPRMGKFTLLKLMDKSSPKLFQAVHSGTVFPEMKIHYVATGSDPVVYSETILSNAMLDHYSESFSGESSHPEEILQVVYDRIERSITPRDSENRATSPVKSGFNLETAESM